MNGNITVPIESVTSRLHCTLTVTHVSRFNFQMRFFIWALKVATWIAPFSTDVTVTGPECR